MREKWDRVQSGSTYGALTIQKAIESCAECYSPCRESKIEFSAIIPLTPQWSELPPFPTEALPETVRRYAEVVALQIRTYTE